MKNFSDTIGNRTRDLPACSAVPQPIALPRAPNRITHSLNPWSSFLLEKLTGSQVVKKFASFYETRRFITAFTRARHLSLS